MDWFERLTGFREAAYDDRRRRLEVERCRLRSLPPCEAGSVTDLKVVVKGAVPVLLLDLVRAQPDPVPLQRFSIGCRGRASARPPAGLKTGRYTNVENALIWKDLSIVILSVR